MSDKEFIIFREGKPVEMTNSARTVQLAKNCYYYNTIRGDWFMSDWPVRFEWVNPDDVPPKYRTMLLLLL